MHTNPIQLFPHIKHIMQKFSKSLPRDDLKKFAKEVGKKLVASDFKNNRVEDPTKISEKQEKKVKKYVRDFFEKAVEKRKALDKARKEKKLAAAKANGNGNGVGKEEAESPEPEPEDEVEFSDHESPSLEHTQSPAPPTGSSSDLKRKRDDGEDSPTGNEDTESNKRLKEDSLEADAPTPPPPPPPPAHDLDLLDSHSLDPDNMEAEEVEGDSMLDVPPLIPEETEEQRELRRQEEDLMRENEEAEEMERDGKLGPVNGLTRSHDVEMGEELVVREREGLQ